MMGIHQNAMKGMLAIILCGLAASSVCAQSINVDADGLAVKGYDVVAYFTYGQPLKGDHRLSYTWKGAQWRFMSSEHLNAFQATPEKYAPQYGGYCAFAVSKGSRADIDPHVWSVTEGKLYLNHSWQASGLWKKNLQNNIAQAGTHWAKWTR